MRGRGLNRQVLAIAGAVLTVLVILIVLIGNSSGLFGTAGEEGKTEVAMADRDSDGVPDDQDNCPDQGDAGYGLTDGCPNSPPPPPVVDTDGDGVLDDVDQCINEGDAGYGLTDGCPNPPPVVDTDGDGVLDDVDQCINEGDAGYGLTNGCPNPPPVVDTDGDGVLDDVDQCINEGDAGYGLTDGCPNPPPVVDTDGDGVLDDVDQCINEGDAGYGLTDGCPNPPPVVDTDGDGITDDVDMCPTESGREQYQGCKNQNSLNQALASQGNPPGQDTNWDKSSVVVSGQCDAQSGQAVFLVHNAGSNMTGETSWRLVDDSNGSVLQSGTLQLTAGEDRTMSFAFPAGVTKLRLYVDQRPGHPGGSNPQADVSSCGTPQQVEICKDGQMVTVPADQANQDTGDCGTVQVCVNGSMMAATQYQVNTGLSSTPLTAVQSKSVLTAR